MEIELQTTIKVAVKFLEVSASARYREDATVNGVPDNDNTLMPLWNGNAWEPTIDLETGIIQNWPSGVVANVHYKVCDEGEYWLQDADGKRVAKWTSFYVPDRFLCIGDTGYGDYIILNIDGAGQIEGWTSPNVGGSDEWESV